ncbi:MAG TPA: hypothetical protein VHO48_02895, partial [Anaerolineaceae bacterium]|nr:hypothetical protein [Anaerolineaceae bacterium]
AYARKLENSFVMADMRTFARAPHFLQNERLFKLYPELLTNLMTQIYSQPARPKEHALALAR